MTSNHRHGTGKYAIAGDVDKTIATIQAQVKALQDAGTEVNRRLLALETPVVEPPPTDEWSSDRPNFKHIFFDDFATDCPEGGFLATYPKWTAYPVGWSDSSKFGRYDPSIASVSGSILRIRHRYQNGAYLVWSGGPTIFTDRYQLYGRYALRFRALTNGAGYKAAYLLWPQSEIWPRDGEIDFPEGDYDRTISAFMHRQGGTSGGDQDAYDTSATFGQWHDAVIEWTPTRCEFFLDGVSIGRSTSRIPNTRMRWQIQSETRIISSPPPQSTVTTVEIDKVSVWSYAP